MRKLISFFALALAGWGGAGGCARATLLDDGYRLMYNMQFDAARQAFQQHQTQHPADPLGHVSEAAAYLFAEFDRLHILQAEFFTNDNNFLNFRKPAADAVLKGKFEAALAQGQKLAGAMLAARPEDADGLFAETLRLGLQADYLALIEKKNMASLGAVKQGRALAERLLARHPEMYDAYIAVGVENYLLSVKPAPVRWLLHAGGAQTDKGTGIEKLKLTAEKGRYLLPYARLLLAVADLRDGRPAEAKRRLAWLAGEFPQNALYREELAKIR